MQHLEELKQVDQLRDPVLVTGFMMRRRAGRLGARAVEYLATQWKAEAIARIDMSPFLNLAVHRPMVFRNEEQARIEWPDGTIYLARPPGANRDIFLLPSTEPDYLWRTYVDTVASYLDGLGVKTFVSLRARPGEVPHTRPAPVYLTATDVDLELQFGVQSTRTRYEGPTSIAGVLAAKVQSMRWRTAELAVVQPDYFPRMPNADAMVSLVGLLDRAFGTRTSLGTLQQTAIDQREMLDRSMSGDPETRATVQEREHAYDLELERMNFLAPPQPGQVSDLPSGDEVLQEVERLFRGGDADD